MTKEQVEIKRLEKEQAEQLALHEATERELSLRLVNARQQLAEMMSPVIRCRDCGGMTLYHKISNGYEVIHACKDGEQVRKMFAEQAEQIADMTVQITSLIGDLASTNAVLRIAHEREKENEQVFLSANAECGDLRMQIAALEDELARVYKAKGAVAPAILTEPEKCGCCVAMGGDPAMYDPDDAIDEEYTLYGKDCLYPAAREKAARLDKGVAEIRDRRKTCVKNLEWSLANNSTPSGIIMWEAIIRAYDCALENLGAKED